MKLPTSIAVLLVLLVPALPAAAQGPVNVAPGNSEVDQYFESVPSGAGKVGVRRGGGGAADPSAGGKPALDPAAAKALEALGDDGRAVAEFVEANPPARGDAAGSGSGTERPSIQVDAPKEGPFPAVVEALAGRTDGEGMGILLPLLLIATVLGASALVLARRQREG